MRTVKLFTIALLCCSFLLSSCGDSFLNLEPTDVASGDQIDDLAKNNPDQIMIVINPLLAGLYNYLCQYNTQGSTGTVHEDFGLMGIYHLGDVMTNDIAFHVGGSGWFTYDYQFDYRFEQYKRPFFYWNFFYTIINRANEIIGKIPEDVEDAEAIAAKGQALAFRGMSYYYLISMFQQTYTSLANPATTPGVPLIYTPAEGESRLNRVPVEEVYEQMTTDLLDAIDLLGDFRRTAKTQIDKAVIQVFLSRVYMNMGKWDEAATMAKSARENSSAQLMSIKEFEEDGFNDIGNKEWMWGGDITAETTTKFASFFSFVCTFDAGYGGDAGQYRKIDARLYALMSDTDVRKTKFKSPTAVVDPESSDVRVRVPAYTNFKFQKVEGWEADYVFMRIAETYLTEAEALAHQGKNGEAATVLRQLMVNRDPSWNKSSVTVDEVYTQRRLELWAEGVSFFDLLRLQKPVERNYEGSNHWAGGRVNIPANDWGLLFQIPLREIQENEEINQEDQNP